MAFTSMQFVMFLVLAVAVYYLTPKRYRWVTLLVVNYVFYYFAGVKYFVYLFATTISTYIATMKLGNMAAENKAAYNAVKAELDRDAKKAWKADLTKKKRRVLVPTLVFNFGILAVLKYSGFVSENLNALFAKISAPVELPVFHFLLPLGLPDHGLSHRCLPGKGSAGEKYWKTGAVHFLFPYHCAGTYWTIPASVQTVV